MNLLWIFSNLSINPQQPNQIEIIKIINDPTSYITNKLMQSVQLLNEFPTITFDKS